MGELYVTFRIPFVTHSLYCRRCDDLSNIEAHPPYHGGLLGAHMHGPSQLNQARLDAMIGTWLCWLPSTPGHRIRLSGGTDAGMDLAPGSGGRDW